MASEPGTAGEQKETKALRRLGLLGGTFDPPHVGHLVAAVWSREALSLDEIWLIVAHEPWQKVGIRTVTPAADRLAMAQALVADVPGVEVSTIELDRGGASYTADTLRELRALDADRELFVLLGTDAAANVVTWERADEVRRDAVMVLVERPGAAGPAVPEGWTFERVEIPRLDISSTDLRERLSQGKPVHGLLPAAVSSVIEARDLYRGVQV